MKKKGFFESMIMMFVIYLFAVALVVVFFYFFKYHITITMIDEYRWNKVQELPLDLLSVDIDGKPFVSGVNRVHYLGNNDEKEQFKKGMDDTITNQFFNYLTGAEYPFRATIKVDGIEVITKYVESTCKLEVRDCEEEGIPAEDYCHCYCSDACKLKNKQLTVSKREKYMACIGFDVSDCTIRKPVFYSAKFPFPLIFNGTDKFVDELSYEVEETK